MSVDPIIIGTIIVGIPIIWLLGLARGPDTENWYAVGETLRKKAKKGDCCSKFIILGIIIIVLLILFAAHTGLL